MVIVIFIYWFQIIISLNFLISIYSRILIEISSGESKFHLLASFVYQDYLGEIL